jgi:hypothetical protein
MDFESRLVCCIHALFTFVCVNLFRFSYQTHIMSSNIILKGFFFFSPVQNNYNSQVKELPGAPYGLCLEDQNVRFRAVCFLQKLPSIYLRKLLCPFFVVASLNLELN